MKDSLYCQAALCQSVERPPVWMMRQAGRYMPEYQAIRGKHRFLDMIMTPELAAEITLQPIHAFGMDAAILFSDILVTAKAMGSELDYVEGIGPVISNPVRSLGGVHHLDTQNIAEKLSYVTSAIGITKSRLKDTPLIGFAGGPFTVASYMIEGGSSKELSRVKQLMNTEPDTLHALLQKLTLVTIDYLNAQITAGVDALQLFDTWANVLSWRDFQVFCLPYLQQILVGLKKPVDLPVTIFCKGSGVFWPLIAELNPNVISLDWQCDISEVRAQLNPKIAVQGNLDPYLLFGDVSILKSQVDAILSSMKNKPGFIFNLGHGILPGTPTDHVKRVVEWIKSS